MRRGVALAALIAALAAAPAQGFDHPTGWNGEHPFVCELQHAGFGERGPHSEAGRGRVVYSSPRGIGAPYGRWPGWVRS